MVCLYCKQEISETDKKRIVAFDRPYANLYVHSECSRLLDNYGVAKFVNNNRGWFDQLVDEFSGIVLRSDAKTQIKQKKRRKS